jgi:hypothetical protein
VVLVEAVTVLVVTVNVALELPALTVTMAGTLAAALSLDSETTTPPVGAGPVNEMVPADEPPPVRLTGFSDTPESATAAGVTLSEAVWVTPV